MVAAAQRLFGLSLAACSLRTPSRSLALYSQHIRKTVTTQLHQQNLCNAMDSNKIIRLGKYPAQRMLEKLLT
jgi:hypothetical protein